MLSLNAAEYRDKVTACWLGKNIGGTLGMPMEWHRQLNDVSFYTQDLDGNPVANDDLDIQLVWLVALEERGVDIDAQTLAEYWSVFLCPHWAEYGISKSNMRIGLPPPLAGSLNNNYKHSCGAFIRSEIWACVAPGCPSLAVKYAYEDAILDHGDGEGTFAEVFTAAIESAAFVVGDMRKLIDIGLSYIPESCAVAKAARAVIKAFDGGADHVAIRDMVLRDFRGRSPNWTTTSKADIDKGYHTGETGYDVPSNIAFVVLGMLIAEKGTFDEMICTTVNCGEDTDCTAATVGSIYGIVHGTASIPERWIKPIGRGIKTCCINTGDLQGRLPNDIDALTVRTEAMMRQVIGRFPECGVKVDEKPSTKLSDFKSLLGKGKDSAVYANLGKPVYRFPFYSVSVDYGDGPKAVQGQTKRLKFKLVNNYKVQTNVSVKAYAPEGWKVSPDSGVVFALPYGGLSPEFEMSFTAEGRMNPANNFVVELSIDGRPGRMHVPVVLINGSLG